MLLNVLGWQIHQQWSLSSIQFWSGFIPVNGGGWIYPTLTAISPTLTLHLAWFMASSFSKPTFFLSFFTCVFHVFFGHPCYLLVIIIQFWSGFIPVIEGGWIYPTLTAISPTPTLHHVRFMASSFSKPTFLFSFSTCVFFGRPCFLLINIS